MAVLEQWVLDGLALNDATFLLESISDPPPQKNAEWIAGSDSDGAILGRVPRYPNRVIEMQIRVAQQATMDLAIAKIALVLDKLQECEQHPNGLALVWTPADATTAGVTARCLMGQIKELPKDWSGSNYFARNPVFTIELTCLPSFDGAEYLEGSVTSSDPMQVLELASVPGDLPAKGRLVVTDAATQSRRYVAWGIESRWYPTSSPASLIIDSASMVTTGFTGVTGTRTGAYSGGASNVITATLRTQRQAVCGLGNLTHIGDFRPYLRFYASEITVAVRLTWQAMDGPYSSLSYKVPTMVGWNLVDLGAINIPQAVLNTQRWTGRLEAYSTLDGGETLDIDVLLLMPAETFARARATYSHIPGTFLARDEFTGIAAGTALNGRVAPLGGTWATSGAATDLAAADTLPDGTVTETMSRTTTVSGTRYAVLATSYTNVEVGMDFYRTASIGTIGLVARWTDATNHAECTIDGTGQQYLSVRAHVGGSKVAISQVKVTAHVSTWWGLRLVIYASGNWHAALLGAGGAQIAYTSGYHSSLATGGTLATGKTGFQDGGSTVANARHYDNWYASTPAAEPAVCFAGQSIEFRHNTTLREDSTGTYAGPPSEPIGGRFFVSPAGTANRKSRVAVIARRNDVQLAVDDFIADSTTMQVYLTPSYLVVPRP